MSYSKKVKQIVKLANQKKWARLADVLEDVLKNNSADLSYDQATAGASWMLNLPDRKQLCLKLAQLAISKDGSRVEAPEVIFSLMFNAGEFANAHETLDLLFKNSPSLSHAQLYEKWQVFLFNKEQNNAAIIDQLDSGKINLNDDSKDLGDISLAVVVALLAFNRIEKARSILDEFLPSPTLTDSNQLNCHAKVCAAEGRVEDALHWFNMIRQHCSEKAAIEARWNSSLFKLSMGMLEEGWTDYEVRWEWEDFTSPKHPLDQLTRWDGRDLSERSILIWGEQGIGDEILFLTLLPQVMKFQPAKIGLVISPKILPVVKYWYPDCELLTHRELRDDIDGWSQRYDFELSAGSLPFVLKNWSVQGDRTVLGRGRAIDRLKTSLFQSYPEAKRIVGLSWRSGEVTYKRAINYLSVKAMAELISAAPEDVMFVALQYGMSDDERAILAATGKCFIPQEDFFDDVLSQSIYIRCCDLVVTSASICLALSGISNVPTITWGHERMWTLLGQKNGYPWFPNVHYIKCEQAWDTGALVVRLKQLMDRFYQF